MYQHKSYALRLKCQNLRPVAEKLQWKAERHGRNDQENSEVGHFFQQKNSRKISEKSPVQKEWLLLSKELTMLYYVFNKSTVER